MGRQVTIEEIDNLYNSFWKEIVEKEDGSINVEQMKTELYDYHSIMTEVTKVYSHATGNVLSKPHYLAEGVISCIESYYEMDALMNYGPDPDMKFKDGEHLTIRDTNLFYRLQYDQDLAAWILVQYKDRNYDETVSKKDGSDIFVFVHDVDRDKLEKIVG